MSEIGFYRMKRLENLLSLTSRQILAEVAAGRFPRPVAITKGSKGFPREKVRAWYQAIIQKSIDINLDPEK